MATRFRDSEKVKADNKKHRELHPDYSKTWRVSNPARYLLGKARYRASKKGIPFDLVEQDVVVPYTCPVLGIPLQLGGDKFNSPSIDRFDNSKGYTKDNIRVISHRANTIKCAYPLEELKAVVRYMEGEEHGI
jgi:hypothetical protein